jgi:hypothetical protein
MKSLGIEIATKQQRQREPTPWPEIVEERANPSWVAEQGAKVYYVGKRRLGRTDLRASVRARMRGRSGRWRRRCA